MNIHWLPQEGTAVGTEVQSANNQAWFILSGSSKAWRPLLCKVLSPPEVLPAQGQQVSGGGPAPHATSWIKELAVALVYVFRFLHPG